MLGFIPAAWGFYLGATGRLPGNAVKEFEHLLRHLGPALPDATLTITPIRDLFGVNWLRYRRALGLLAFYYVMMHFLTYMVLDQTLILPAILADIAAVPSSPSAWQPSCCSSAGGYIEQLVDKAPWATMEQASQARLRDCRPAAAHFAMVGEGRGAPSKCCICSLWRCSSPGALSESGFCGGGRQGTAPVRSQARADKGASRETAPAKVRDTSPGPSFLPLPVTGFERHRNEDLLLLSIKPKKSGRGRSAPGRLNGFVNRSDQGRFGCFGFGRNACAVLRPLASTSRSTNSMTASGALSPWRNLPS